MILTQDPPRDLYCVSFTLVVQILYVSTRATTNNYFYYRLTGSLFFFTGTRQGHRVETKLVLRFPIHAQGLHALFCSSVDGPALYGLQ